jgi:membrane protein YqaA with SNARE-associated domain
MITEEAYKQLIDIQQKEILSSSQNIRLSEWLDLMEEIQSKVPATLNRDEWDNQKIKRLQDELKKCSQDLKSDEHIFAEKNIEISGLKERLADLVSVVFILTTLPVIRAMVSSFSPGLAMGLLQELLCYVVGRACTFLLLAPIFGK